MSLFSSKINDRDLAEYLRKADLRDLHRKLIESRGKDYEGELEELWDNPEGVQDLTAGPELSSSGDGVDQAVKEYSDLSDQVGMAKFAEGLARQLDRLGSRVDDMGKAMSAFTKRGDVLFSELYEHVLKANPEPVQPVAVAAVTPQAPVGTPQPLAPLEVAKSVPVSAPAAPLAAAPAVEVAKADVVAVAPDADALKVATAQMAEMQKAMGVMSARIEEINSATPVPGVGFPDLTAGATTTQTVEDRILADSKNGLLGKDMAYTAMRVAHTYRGMKAGSINEMIYKAELAGTPPQVQTYFQEAK